MNFKKKDPLDYDSQMTDKYFVEYTRIEVKHFKDTLLQHMGNVKKSIAERTRHQRQYDKRVNKRQMQTQKSKIDKGKVVDADLVVTESSGTESEVQDDSIMSGNDTYADDVDIRPIFDREPMVEILSLRNSVDTKFAKTSVLGKPVLQSPRYQSVVRQPNVFKSKRPQLSKPWFASQVDVNNNLSRPVTQHYFPKRRESAFAKPDNMIASSESRNSSKNMPRFSSNDMVHNHYLDEARKKTQERDNIADGSKPKPRSTNHSTRSLPVSKSSCVTIATIPIADHSKNSNSFSDSKHFIPTGKILAYYISKDDSEPTHGSNVDIPNIHECKQTMDLSACTSINVQKEQSFDLSAVVSKSSAVTTGDASNKRQQQPDSTSSTSTLAITVTADGNFDISYALSWKPCQGDSLNLPDHRFRRRCCSLIPAKSDS
ncbi:hypothetical protein Tco_1201152 [Tanacetum coccineum]